MLHSWQTIVYPHRDQQFKGLSMILGWIPCVQVTSHLKCNKLVSVRSSLPCINIGVRVELTLDKLAKPTWLKADNPSNVVKDWTWVEHKVKIASLKVRVQSAIYGDPLHPDPHCPRTYVPEQNNGPSVCPALLRPARLPANLFTWQRFQCWHNLAEKMDPGGKFSRAPARPPNALLTMLCLNAAWENAAALPCRCAGLPLHRLVSCLLKESK